MLLQPIITRTMRPLSRRVQPYARPYRLGSSPSPTPPGPTIPTIPTTKIVLNTGRQLRPHSSSSSSSSTTTTTEAQPASDPALRDHEPSVFPPSTASSASESSNDSSDSSTGNPFHLNPAEQEIYNCLTAALHPSALEVQDISGGCGSMYALNVTSESFRGLSVMKQHRLVNAALGERVREWHGVQVRTAVP